MKARNIILFDGVCNLCEHSIVFIIKHDPNGHFYFASQSSKQGKKLLNTYHLKHIDSIVLIKQNKAYCQSDAVLEIAKALDGGYKFIYVFRFVPKKLRDFFYRLVAKHRYQFFGKKNACMMPTQAIKNRFLS